MGWAGIRTGEVVGIGLTEPGRAAGVPFTNELFGPRSVNVQSRFFCVANGGKKLLSAWGLQGTDFVRIFKLKVRPGKLNTSADACGCEVDLTTDPEVIYSKEYGECNELIQMHCAQDELALPGPACYRLELGDPTMLGRVYIEMQNLDT